MSPFANPLEDISAILSKEPVGISTTSSVDSTYNVSFGIPTGCADIGSNTGLGGCGAGVVLFTSNAIMQTLA